MVSPIDDLSIAENYEQGHYNQRQFTANVQPPAKMVFIREFGN